MPDVSNFNEALSEHQESVNALNSDEERRFDQDQLARVNAVLDAILSPFGDAFADDPQRLRDEYKLKVNNAIKANLDLHSIWSFIEIVAANYKSIDASRSANIKHSGNRSRKAKVFSWLDSNMVKFKSMDAAAQAIANHEPIAFRTARDWVGDWKKLRSTGTP
jgi:hypothetical protein